MNINHSSRRTHETALSPRSSLEYFVRYVQFESITAVIRQYDKLIGSQRSAYALNTYTSSANGPRIILSH